MGCGASNSQKKTHFKGTQTGNTARTQAWETSTYSPSPSSAIGIDGPFAHPRGNSRPQSPSITIGMEWPLPPDRDRGKPTLNNFSQSRFTLRRRPASASGINEIEDIMASNPVPYEQKDSGEMSITMDDMQTTNSAHVKSQLVAKSKAQYHLATSAAIEVLMKNHKNIYTNVDSRVKRRLEEASTDADKILSQIIEEANTENDKILKYDKEQQEAQEKLHQEWLQKYVVVLNKWRARQLAGLQKELLEYQQEIAKRSQKYIELLSEETNSLKASILREEQENARAKTEALAKEIESITSAGKIQQLDSFVKTEVVLNVEARVG